MEPNSSQNKRNWIRWVARLLALIVGGLWLFITAVSAIDEGISRDWETIAMIAFMIGSPIVLAAAWKKEKIGGLVLVGYSLLFSTFGYFSAGRNKLFAVMVSGGPFLLVGLAFLASWWSERQSESYTSLEGCE